MEHEIESLFPLIVGLRGRLGDRVFYMRNGGLRARRHVVPSNPRTALQQEGRSRFARAVARWRALDDGARSEWNRRARKRQRTGYNLFIGECLRHSDGTSAASREPALIAHAPAVAAPPRLPADTETARSFRGGIDSSPPFQYANSSVSIPMYPAAYRATNRRTPKFITTRRSRSPGYREAPRAA